MNKKPAWQQVLDWMPLPYQDEQLRLVLRTRRKLIPIGLNGIAHMVPRAVVRDYLRQVTSRTK